jgi:hypothetical protein
VSVNEPSFFLFLFFFFCSCDIDGWVYISTFLFQKLHFLVLPLHYFCVFLY